MQWFRGLDNELNEGQWCWKRMDLGHMPEFGSIGLGNRGGVKEGEASRMNSQLRERYSYRDEEEQLGGKLEGKITRLVLSI